jgi:hypothetical protein
MQVGVLCNMAELVVRQLEKSWAAEQLRKAKVATRQLVSAAFWHSLPCRGAMSLPC